MSLFGSVLFILYLGRISTIRTDSLTTVWSNLGAEATLSCPFSTSIEGDKPIIIIWSKSTSSSSTIYSYDVRNSSSFYSGNHWKDEDILGTRSHFRVFDVKGDLIIDPVVKADHGIYKCRIVYRMSSATVHSLNLTVVLPPEDPVIKWKGKEVMGIISSILEGEEVFLTCETSGGRPTPELTWLREGNSIGGKERVIEVGGTTIVSSKIRFTATRDLHLNSFMCQALPKQIPGHLKTVQLTTSVTLNLTLPPTSVQITGLAGPISAETVVMATCRAKGSSPAAQITLWKGNKRLSKVTRTVKDRGYLTEATATILVRREDHRSNITCQGINPAMKNTPTIVSTLTDVVSLNVYYEPEVTLELKQSINQDRYYIEGENAILKCHIKANPPSHRIEWSKGGILMENSSNILVDGSNLLFTNLSRNESGIYRCSAENLQGKSLSNSIEINVKYAPICSLQQNRTIGIALNKTAQVTCRVEADPATNIHFQWYRILKNGQIIDIDSSKVSSIGSVSYATISTSTVDDFGPYYCNSSNPVGKQNNPCVIVITPAGPPEPPVNCRKFIDSGTVVVSCKEGFNGGLKQNFHLEVWLKDELVRNKSDEFSEWKINGIEAGANFTLKIYSSNAKGVSSSILLPVILPKISQEHRKDEEHQNSADTIIILGSAAGVLIMLMLVIITSVIICWKRKNRTQKCTENLNAVAGTSPDVIASNRNPQATPIIDVLENAPILNSSRYIVNERGQLSGSNSSVDYESSDISRRICHAPYIHSAGLYKARSSCGSSHFLEAACNRHRSSHARHHRHHYRHPTKKLSASAYQLSSSSGNSDSSGGSGSSMRKDCIPSKYLLQKSSNTATKATLDEFSELDDPLLDNELYNTQNKEPKPKLILPQSNDIKLLSVPVTSAKVNRTSVSDIDSCEITNYLLDERNERCSEASYKESSL